MKLSDRSKKKRTGILVGCVAILLLAVGGSYAAYTREAYQRGVAGNRDTETVNFHSNYLQLCADGTQDSSYSVKSIVYGAAEDTLTFDISVYNYVEGNREQMSQKDITYTMKIAFSDGGNKGYKVACDDGAAETVQNNVYEVTKTLPGRAPNENKFTISFPGSDLDQVQIIATATPTDTAVTNNQLLAARLIPCTGTSGSTFRATGDFIDKNEGDPSDYDAFNYEVAISSGEATATLTWDTDVVEIDSFFLKKIGKTGDNEIKAVLDTGKLTFTMNQSDGTGDYLIPFYIKDKNRIPASWLLMKNIISFDATQTE